MISRLIANEMRGAQAALNSGDWNGALQFLAAAKAKSPLTSYDRRGIFDFEGYAYIKLNKLRDAQNAYEDALATGAYTPTEAIKTRRTVAQLASGNSDYTTAINYGEQLAAADAATPADLSILAQAFYLEKDCPRTDSWADKAIAATRAAGGIPTENLYLFKLQCATYASNAAGMRNALIDLILLTHKPEHWNALLRLERQDERDDHGLLMIYRLMHDTHSMFASPDYMEMAQLLGDAGLPGEAIAVLSDGKKAGVFKENRDIERVSRLLDALGRRADSDERTLERFGRASPDGANDDALAAGEHYFGFSQYEHAVVALESAISRGNLHRLDDAYVYLGRSQHALGNDTEASAAFARLQSVPNVSERIQKLFEVYADTLSAAKVAETF